MEDQAAHIVGEVDEGDLGLSAVQADGADEERHVRLFLREDMFDPCAYSRLCPVGSAQRL